MTDLRARGVDDILIAPIDGLTGFPDAIEAVFPQTQIHTCVVPLVRRSLPSSRSKTAGVWRACSERSIGPRPWPPRRPRCQRLPRVPRATAIRPSRRSGAGSGNTSRRPSRIRPRFDASSPPRMRSRVYTASCARSSRPAVTSQPTKPRPSSCISHYATSKNAGIQRHRFVRHPGYLGSLLCLNGIAPASGNTFTLLASIAATFAAYAYRIRVEDAMLVAAFGAPYERYRRETGAILPFFRVHGESV